MVAKTPTKEKKMAAALNPNLLRETVKKVDRCMARLQELQYTVSGGAKTISGVNLSPRSTRGYLRTSIRCKQESLRLKKAAEQISPTRKGKEQTAGDWRRMSLPAMLIGETISEILQTSQFAKDIVVAVTKANKSASKDPKTPISNRKTIPLPKNTEYQLRAKRKTEKQPIQSEYSSPKLQRARSRINFKAYSPKRESAKEVRHLVANRISPRNRPWAKKTVLFPNPLFLSSPSSQQQKFCKTRSPVIARTRQQTPHKFLVKSPVKIQPSTKNGPGNSTVAGLVKRSPKISRLRHSFSPSKLVSRLASPLKNRISPLKNRFSMQSSGGLIRGLKERPPVGYSVRKF